MAVKVKFVKSSNLGIRYGQTCSEQLSKMTVGHGHMGLMAIMTNIVEIHP